MTKDFTQQAVVNCDEIIINNNPFQIEAMFGCDEHIKYDDSYKEDFKEELKSAIQNIDFISINKKYGKLQKIYNDVKKMASTYMDTKTEENSLSKKLSRYIS